MKIFELSAAVKIGSCLLVIASAVALLAANAAAQAPRVTACDILTAHPDDPNRVASPVAWNERDAARAVPACEEAVKQDPGNVRLRYQLGLAQDSAGNHVESFRHYTAAAERGYVAAGMAVGWALANGEGVNRNDELAVRWYRWAADRRHSGAANTLGFMHENGRGVPRNLAQAAEWYRRAYEMDARPVAGYNYARLIAAGRDVPRDLPRAVQVLRAVVQAGRSDAALHLALMAERNEAPGVSQSEMIQLLAFAETAPAQQDRALRSLSRMAAQGHTAEIQEARRATSARVAERDRQDELLRRSRERSYAAAIGRVDSVVRSDGPPRLPSRSTGAERTPASSLNTRVSARVTPPAQIVLGSKFSVQWSISGVAPPKPSMVRESYEDYLSGKKVTRVREVDRSLLDLGRRWTNDSRREMIIVSVPEAVRVRGSGFIAIQPGARMPFDANFEQDRLRLVFPLYLPESQSDGSVEIRPFLEGLFDVKIFLVSDPRNGVYNEIREIESSQFRLIDGNPKIIVQDKIYVDPPIRSWLSPPQKNRPIAEVRRLGDRPFILREYATYFELSTSSTGGLIEKIAGSRPTFHTNPRFVVYEADDLIKVYDVLAREVIFSGSGLSLEASAFYENPSLIYIPRYGQGDFVLFSPYVDGVNFEVDVDQVVREGIYRGHGSGAVRSSIDGLLFSLESAVVLQNNPYHIEYFIPYSFLKASHRLSGEIPSRVVLTARAPLTVRASFSHMITGSQFPIASDNDRLSRRPGGDMIYSNNEYLEIVKRNIVQMREIQPSATSVSDVISPGSGSVLRGMSFEQFLPENLESRFPVNQRDAVITINAFISKYDSAVNLIGPDRILDTVTLPKLDTNLLDFEDFIKNFNQRITENFPRSLRRSPAVESELNRLRLTLISNRNFDYLYPPAYREAILWEFSDNAMSIVMLRVLDDNGGNGGIADGWCIFSSSHSRALARSCGIGPTDPREQYTDVHLQIEGWDEGTSRYLVALSPDRQLIAAANRHPGEVWIFRVHDGVVAPTKIMLANAANALFIGFLDNQKLIVQYNTDGRIYIYNTERRELVLSGVLVDGEFVIFDAEGFYDASYEGQRYAYRFFPGTREHHSFAQFSAHFYRPDIIRSILADRSVVRPQTNLEAPPKLEFEVSRDPTNPARIHLLFEIQGYADLSNIRLFRDGLPLGQVALSGRASQLSQVLELPYGRHNISAVAYDARGFSSNAKTVPIQIGPDPRAAGQLHYVGIAVNDYPRMPPDQSLRFAVRDAELLRDTMLGQQTQRRGRVHATVLADVEATRENILASLRRAAEQTGQEDVLVVSFAGHGAREGERFFFLPHQGSFEDPARSGVEWSAIAAALAPAKGRVLVLLDACHSGAARGDAIVPNDSYAEQLMSSGRAGLAVLAAAKGRQSSFEDASLGGGHGFFSYMIARALGADRATADRDRSGTIELDELYAFVRRNVSERTKNAPGGQTPWLAREEFIGRVSLF